MFFLDLLGFIMEFGGVGGLVWVGVIGFVFIGVGVVLGVIIFLLYFVVFSMLLILWIVIVLFIKILGLIIWELFNL